jgi:hypothetical protein
MGQVTARALLAVLVLALAGGGCITDLIKGLVHVEPRDAEPGMADAPPFDGAVPDHLTVNSIKPDHGPFVGGTEVVIYGFGFTAATKVRVGGRAPAQDSFNVLSPVALKLTTPAGEVGAAEVEVDNGTEIVRKPGGFTYDPVALDPAAGPSAGGTLISVLGMGTSFSSGMKLTLGGQPLTEVEVVSTTLVRAKTPPGAEGPAELVWSDGGADRHAPNAFTYYSSASPKSGGMGGGPLQGTLTVAVLNWLDRSPIPGAQVSVQRARVYQAQAKTNAKGVAVFTSPDLKGPVTVTAAMPDFEASTILSFDARDLTIFLMPIPKPQPGPTGPGTLGALVMGNVVFGGPTGAGSPQWNIVPAPKEGQVKRTYVYMTFPSVDWGPQQPTSTATIDFDGKGQTAWPYQLDAWPGTHAVYAVAGLFNKATSQFDAYALGIKRGVVLGPGDVQYVDVSVEIPLTEKITVEIEDQPPQLDKHQVRLGISLGADGYILREDQEARGDGQVQSQVFARMPSFAHQALLDATYTVDVQLQSGATGLPMARATQRSVLPKGGVITIADFVGVPLQVKPAPGTPLAGNTLAWSHDGAEASLAVTTLTLSDATPVWRVISRGDVTTAKLPDPQSLGLSGWPSGPLVWNQWLAHIPGFSFDSFNYTYLSSSTWDRWSADAFEIQVP